MNSSIIFDYLPILDTQWNTNDVKPTANAIPAKMATTPPNVDNPVTACVVESVVKNISVTAWLSPLPIPVTAYFGFRLQVNQ